MILALRTDKPEAEIYVLDSSGQMVEQLCWQAHLQLSDTIHIHILQILRSHQKDLQDIAGVIVFRGPGSYTGLRIGCAVANALAASLHVAITGSSGDTWINDGFSRLRDKKTDTIVLPEYAGNIYTN